MQADDDLLVQEVIAHSEWSTYIQTIGRGRAALRTKENPLKVYLITATPLKGVPIANLTKMWKLMKQTDKGKARFYQKRDELNKKRHEKALAKVKAAIIKLLKEGKQLSINAIHKLSGVRRFLIVKLRRILIPELVEQHRAEDEASPSKAEAASDNRGEQGDFNQRANEGKNEEPLWGEDLDARAHLSAGAQAGEQDSPCEIVSISHGSSEHVEKESDPNPLPDDTGEGCQGVPTAAYNNINTTESKPPTTLSESAPREDSQKDVSAGAVLEDDPIFSSDNGLNRQTAAPSSTFQGRAFEESQNSSSVDLNRQNTKSAVFSVEEAIAKLNEDERESFEERAAIIEFDGCKTREEAEKLALEMILNE